MELIRLVRSIDGIGTAASFVIACIALAAGLGVSPQAHAQGMTVYNNSCSTNGTGCHAFPPEGARLNAANASAVITQANTTHGMGFSAGFMTANAANIATYIGTLITASQTVNVNYNATVGFTVNDIVLNNAGGGIITTINQVSAPSRGNMLGSGTASVSYQHTATNCTSDSFQVRGQGLQNTSNRTINITVNAPSAPVANNANTTISYSTSAQSINLTSLGAISGTAPTTNVSLGTPSPNLGTLSATGANTFTYASNATTYAPTLTFNYSVNGPCGTSSATRTFTLNVNAPPAPTVANVGPLVVPDASPTMIDLTSSISGVTASNPAGTYNLAASQPSAAGSGSTSVAGNVVTYTPSGTFTGTTTFTYTKDGPGGTSNVGTVTLNVTSAPVVTGTTATTAFNTPVAVNLAAFITGTATSVTPSSPTNGTAMATGPTTITFTPTAGFIGTGSFQYTATGPGGTSPTPATVTITVNPPPPIAGAGVGTVGYNTPTAINLAPFITGGTPTSVTPSGAVNGTVMATGPTTVTFTPTAGYIGPASFNYTATNAGGTSGSAAVAVTVTAPAAPTANNLTLTVGANGPTTIDMTPSVTGFATTVAAASLPANGLVSAAGMVFTYTPAAGFTGTDSFTYTATGPGGTSAPATITLTVTGAPVARPINVTTAFNTPVTVNLANGVSGSFTSVSASFNAANGTVTNDTVANQVVYTPNQGYFGNDTFTYIAVGPGGVSSQGTVTVTVLPLAPVANNTTVNVAFGVPTVIDLTAATQGVATSITITQQPSHGTVTVSGVKVTYTPAAGYSGPDSFKYTASGLGGVGVSEGTVEVIVGTQVPAAQAAALVVQLNSSATLELAPFIKGSSISGVSITTAAKHGTVDVNGTKVTYTPKTNFFGADSFAYVAYGNAGSSSPATVSVTVEGRPDPRQDRNVTGTVSAQTQAAKRFARAQMSNYQQRLESLRAPPEPPAETAPAAVPGKASQPPVQNETPQPKAPRTYSRDTGAEALLASLAPDIALRGEQPGWMMRPVNDTGVRAKPATASTWGVAPTRLLASAVSVASSGAASVAMSSNRADGMSLLPDNTSVWIGGNVSFGTRDSTGDVDGFKFSTEGVSVGIDRRFNDRLILGLGIGHARDETDIGTQGSRSKAKGTSVAVYGSYQPTRNTFVDGVVGVGKIDFDGDRYVESVEEFARSRRKSDQFFASIGAGYEYRSEGWLLSPYARLDLSRDKLKQATESGAGLNALTFNAQSVKQSQLALGLRFSSQHEANFGLVRPRVRVEYRHEFEKEGTASIAYADQFAGLQYSVAPVTGKRNYLVFGVGSDFLHQGGLKIGIDYQAQRSSGIDTAQAVRILITQELDGKGLRLGSWRAPSKNPVSVEAGYTWDDNVTRARDAASKLTDHVFNLGLGTNRIYPLGTHTRGVVSGFLNGEKFHTYSGLGHAAAGLQGELQYRVSSAFDAPTFTAFLRATAFEYESRLRDGHRFSLGVTARRSLTDKIDIFGEISGTHRSARSAVFDGRDYSAKFNVDYSLGRNGTLYLGGEYRRGDSVSVGRPSLENLVIAEVLVQDDAYPSGEFFAYRFESRTLIGTMGYNRPLGPRDSIDFSWRHARSTPLSKPDFSISGPFRYDANQYSIVYLMRF
jgi:uncharacterized protein YhjY with autotransporter beta-barrel domain